MLPKKSDNTVVTERLYREWIVFGGDWNAFVEVIRERGKTHEVATVERCPAEFRTRATDVVERLKGWVADKSPEVIEKVYDLAMNAKTVKDGETVDDNKTQLAASKEFLDLLKGSLKKEPPPPRYANPSTEKLEQLSDLIGILNGRGIDVQFSESGRPVRSGDTGQD